jgi:hypothetical protein
MMLLGGGAGFGDDFERDNFAYVQAAVAATPPAALVLAPAPWLATTFSARPTVGNSILRGTPPPASQAAVSASVTSSQLPPPPTGAQWDPQVMSVVGGSAVPVTFGGPGPNVAALQAEWQAAGVTTDQQAAAWLTALDGQPAPTAGLTESAAAYYLAVLAKKRQIATWTKVAIAAGIGAGALLLLRR